MSLRLQVMEIVDNKREEMNQEQARKEQTARDLAKIAENVQQFKVRRRESELQTIRDRVQQVRSANLRELTQATEEFGGYAKELETH
jgi:hypothetical protein